MKGGDTLGKKWWVSVWRDWHWAKRRGQTQEEVRVSKQWNLRTHTLGGGGRASERS